jgi:uncharacterized protein YkwD
MGFRILVAVTLLILVGCTQNTEANLGPNGLPYQRTYLITESDISRIQFNMLDGINSIRTARSLKALVLNPQLNAAAATHSRDMSIQNRAWHFGSDGSSPPERLLRVGYEGNLLGENISETFESELETLAAWMENPATRGVVLTSSAEEIGFSWFQEDGGKIWWTLVIGSTKSD